MKTLLLISALVCASTFAFASGINRDNPPIGPDGNYQKSFPPPHQERSKVIKERHFICNLGVGEFFAKEPAKFQEENNINSLSANAYCREIQTRSQFDRKRQIDRIDHN